MGNSLPSSSSNPTPSTTTPSTSTTSIFSNFSSNAAGFVSGSNSQRLSDVTREKVMEIFYVLRANPKVSIQKIEGLLSIIPRNEPILALTDSSGYNILQKAVSLNHIEIVKWILSRGNSHVDVNRGPCSLPLHIACYKGYKEIVELLLSSKYKARADIEVRLCWPGPHHINCEQRSHNCFTLDHHLPKLDRSSEKLQNAVFYAVDGDHPAILELLLRSPTCPTAVSLGGISNSTSPSANSTNSSSSSSSNHQNQNHHHQQSFLSSLIPTLPSFRLTSNNKRPLLHVACERGAYNCFMYLLNERPEEINMVWDEFYPIHHAVLLCKDEEERSGMRFLKELLRHGASPPLALTTTENMTVLHVLFYRRKASSEDCFQMAKLLLENGMRDLINSPDSLGNTCLHALIVRYALEESRFSVYHEDYPPWSRWDVLHLIRYLLSQGAKPSINQPGNSALACVLRHVRDWEFRYELLSMLLSEGGDPNIVGRDGSVPLMVCLVPLINKDLLHHFTHNMKVLYLNCIRILLKHGAEVNCSTRTHLTPLHVLIFAASEYMGLVQSEEKRASFEFTLSLLSLLLQFGLNPNTSLGSTSRTQHILVAVLELVNLVRNPSDLDYVYDLTLMLIQHGADVEVDVLLHPSEHELVSSQSSFYLKKCGSYKPVFYYVSWLCKKDHLLLDPERRFQRIIELYASAMGQRSLYTTLHPLYTHSAIIPVRTALCQCIKKVLSNPKSLASLARLTIYKCLKRRTGKWAGKLPLPGGLVKWVNFC